MEETNLDNWKQIQTKTFTKWVNSKLKKADFPSIENLFSDLSSGIALVNLLAALGKIVPKYNKSPNSRIQKMENMNIILEFIRSQNISLVNIGPEDIVDGDQKLILGLIWTLISKLSMSEIFTREFLSLREEVLAWAQRVTSCYNHFKIQNLTVDWQDGIAFSAIVHRFRPNLIPHFFSINPEEGIKNCEAIFKLAEEKLDIPRLFDPEDIVDVLKPDEKSILTYLSQFYLKFLSEEAIMNSKNNLSNLFKGVNYAIEAKNSYETLAKTFLEKKKVLLSKSSVICEITSKLSEELKRLEKLNSELITDSVQLSLILDNINDVNMTFGLKRYVPAPEIAIENTTISYLPVDTLFNLSEITQSLEQFYNSEAKEIEIAMKVSRDIYLCSNKDDQVQSLLSNPFKEQSFSVKSKQKAFDTMKSMLDEKTKKSELFVDLKKNCQKLISNGRKLFIAKDLKNVGFITRSEFVKILRSLGLETLNLSRKYGDNSDLVSMECLEQEITNLSMFKLPKELIKQSFENCSGDLAVKINEIIPETPMKGLNTIAQKEGIVSYDSIASLFE